MPDMAIVSISDFPGIVLDADTHDIQPGASDYQVNCTSDEMGVLQSRLGILPVSFEGE